MEEEDWLINRSRKKLIRSMLDCKRNSSNNNSNNNNNSNSNSSNNNKNKFNH
jgi:hypothetical protein